MAEGVVIDPQTLSQRKSYRKLLIPGAAALIVMILGFVFFLSQAATSPLPLPKIKMSASGFTNSVTGRAFVPRGANYVRLASAPDGGTYHSTFEPGQYTSSSAQNIINNLKGSGYNTVRVFIDPGAFTTPSHGISTAVGSTDPINAAYMSNVVDFVNRAAIAGIYTIPILDSIPANTFYYNTAGSPQSSIQGNNVMYLDAKFVQAKEIYVKKFISALLTGLGNANSSSILAYETDNEVFFDASKAPFSTMSGTVTTVDGGTYDMSKTAQRQQAADANLVAYSTRMKQAITSVDPAGLFTLGFFTNNAVGKSGFNGFTTYCSTQCKSGTDYRVPGRPGSVSTYAQIDFLDMHTYPSSTDYSLKTDLASSEYTQFKKPYILGEFGAVKTTYSNNITKAATAMKSLQTTSCSLNAKGWLFWTWDTNTTTTLADQSRFYSLVDSKGAINGQLAPTARTDPCK